MAQAMKSWYVTVMCGYKQVYQRKCVSAQQATEILAKVKEDYPTVENGPVYSYHREQF